MKIVEFKQSHAASRGRLRIAITLHDGCISARLQGQVERRFAAVRRIEVIAANCLCGCAGKGPVIISRYLLLIRVINGYRRIVERVGKAARRERKSNRPQNHGCRFGSLNDEATYENVVSR